MGSNRSRASFTALIMTSTVNEIVLLSAFSLTVLQYGFLAPVRPTDEGLGVNMIGVNMNCLLIGDEVWHMICYGDLSNLSILGELCGE